MCQLAREHAKTFLLALKKDLADMAIDPRANKLIFAGGGAALLNRLIIETFGERKVIIDADSFYANSIGTLKLLKAGA
ncbi:MAG: hypothetical protein FWF59_11525 [Turicibacter sp.]|nr:hypothetical protein [Turicibacter sp.]